MEFFSEGIARKNNAENYLLEIVEHTLRSLNNTLEHLHQSFFFYRMIDSLHFVAISNYIISPAILLVSLPLSFLLCPKNFDQESTFALIAFLCSCLHLILVSTSNGFISIFMQLLLIVWTLCKMQRFSMILKISHLSLFIGCVLGTFYLLNDIEKFTKLAMFVPIIHIICFMTERGLRLEFTQIQY